MPSTAKARAPPEGGCSATRSAGIARVVISSATSTWTVTLLT
jgi:hypothetical protein